MTPNIENSIIDALVDKGYIVIDDAFDRSLIDQLRSECQQMSPSFKKAGIGRGSDLKQDNRQRKDSILWLEPQKPAQTEFLKQMDGLKLTINRSLFMGLFDYESHFAIYKPGDFYKKHLDAFQGRSNRKFSTVLYLNEDWQEQDGGELVVWNQNDQQLEKIMPKAGRLVCFLSDQFPHEVLAANKTRYSIAGWFRINETGNGVVNPGA